MKAQTFQEAKQAVNTLSRKLFKRRSSEQSQNLTQILATASQKVMEIQVFDLIQELYLCVKHKSSDRSAQPLVACM